MPKPDTDKQIKTRAPGLKKRTQDDMFKGLRRPSENVSDAAEVLGLAGPHSPSPAGAEDSSAGGHDVLTPVATPVITGVATGAPTPVATPVTAPAGGGAEEVAGTRPAQPQSLDATHTASQQQIYSIMYRQTISRGVREAHFRPKELMAATGIRSDRTVRTALDGLIEKLSVEIVWNRNGYPLGPRYRVYEPKEIQRRRRAAGLEIDPQTKKVITPVVTPVITPVATGANNYPGSPAETTGATGVDFAGVNTLNRSNVIGDRNLSPASSSSESPARAGDDDEDAFVLSVRSIYERLTGNAWETADELTLAQGIGITAEAWGMALCHCVDRAPGHTFNRLAYALDEARRHQDVMGGWPATDLRAILRRTVGRLEQARLGGVWDVPAAPPPAAETRPAAATPATSAEAPGDADLLDLAVSSLHAGLSPTDVDAQIGASVGPERWPQIRQAALARYESEKPRVERVGPGAAPDHDRADN